MKATCWMGKKSVEVVDVPEPQILNQRDAIVRITSTAICGSDLHLYNGFMPGMQSGDIIGHEFMGEVVDVGRDNKKLKVGDRVVVPFTITCGACDQCRRGNFSVCERSNRNKDVAALHRRHEAVVEMQVGAADRGRGDAHDGVARVQDLRVRDVLDPDVLGAFPAVGKHRWRSSESGLREP